MGKRVFRLVLAIVMIAIFFGLIYWLRLAIFVDFESAKMASTLSQIIAAAITGGIVYFLHRIHITPEMRIDVHKAYPKFLLRAMYFKVSLVCMVQGLLFIAFAFTDLETFITGNTSRFSDATPIEMLFIFVSVVIAAPLIEEVLVRGLLFGSLKELIGLPGAIIISGVIFGALHGTSVATVVGTAAAGIALAYIYAMTKNLFHTIIIHSILNLIVLVKVFIGGEAQAVGGVAGFPEWLLILISLLMIVICLGIGVMAIKGMKRELKQYRLKGRIDHV